MSPAPEQQSQSWAREGKLPVEAAEKPAEPAEAEDDFDFDDEERQFKRDEAIQRIMEANRKDPFAVMGIMPGIPEEDIRKIYRKTSLFIHPDKAKHPQASEAFDRLAKSNQELGDKKLRERIEGLYADARRYVCKDKGWSLDSPELKTDLFYKKLWPEKVDILIYEDLHRLDRQKRIEMEEEGRRAQAAEEHVSLLKRKRQAEKDWEEGRDKRVGDWRKFVNGKDGRPGAPPKSKKKKGAKNKDGLNILA